MVGDCTREPVRLAFRDMTIRQHWSLAALILVPLLAGCPRTAEGPQEEQTNPFYKAGKEKLQAMDYAGAISSFERALQDNPRSVLAHFELGIIYDQHLPDYPAALYHYNKAVKLRPTGYPADTIKFRIPACRQELVKADSLSILSSPSALREMEKLREENQELRRQLGELRSGRAPAPGVASGNPARGPTNGLVSSYVAGPGGSRVPAGSISGTSLNGGSGPTGPTDRTGATSTNEARVHVLRSGETLASVSRRYNVRLEALLAANRGLDPKRLKVGQTIRVPGRP